MQISAMLSNCLSDDVCSEKSLEILKRIPYKIYDRILNQITGQESTIKFDPKYSLFKIGIQDEISQCHIESYNMEDKDNYPTIQADDTHILLNIFDIQTVMLMLSNVTDNRYMFLPIVYGSEVNECGHFAFMAFDKFDNKVYFVDPNGRSSFFDDILIVHAKKDPSEPLKGFYNNMYIKSETHVEKLFDQYVNMLNSSFDLSYKFVPRKSWNANKICINKDLGRNNVIGNGHCVMTSTLLINYLHITQVDVYDALRSVGQLSTYELSTLINAYSSGICNLFLS